MDQFEFEDLSVAAVYKSYPQSLRSKLLGFRQLIFEAAADMDGVKITETLKWGEPSYAANGGIGTPIRLAPAKEPDHVGIYVHCQTSLINDFRASRPGAFRYSGTRALLIGPDDRPAEKDLRDFIAAALTYHRNKAKAAKA